MNTGVFTSFCLSFCLIYMGIYAEMREHFNKEDYHRYKMEQAQYERDQTQFALESSLAQLFEMRQEVAALVPELNVKRRRGAEGYPLRRLASVSSGQEMGSLANLLGGQHFQRSKKLFRQGNYRSAIPSFKQFISDFPYSVHMVEAHYLLSESYFQDGQLGRFVSQVEEMIRQFPEDEVTGFAMIRLGQVFETQDRFQEAVGLYKTMLQSFQQPEVGKRAREALASVRL